MTDAFKANGSPMGAEPVGVELVGVEPADRANENSDKPAKANSPAGSPTSPLIVTLDGPAGVGKSTLAKQVAEALGIGYLDTGAMFRVIALKSLQQPDPPTPDSIPGSIPNDDGSALLASMLPLSFRLSSGSGHSGGGSGSGETAGSELLCNGEPIGDAIRSEEVAAQAARIAAFPAIRSFLKAAQQDIGKTTSLVAEGRDMGTVVFPQAQYKFFLDASVEVRAKRRYDQLVLMHQPADINEIARQIRERDNQDRNRSVAPLVAAKDAVIIDTSHLPIEGVLAAILQHCRKP